MHSDEHPARSGRATDRLSALRPDALASRVEDVFEDSAQSFARRASGWVRSFSASVERVLEHVQPVANRFELARVTTSSCSPSPSSQRPPAGLVVALWRHARLQ